MYVVPISDDPRRFEPGSQLFHGDGRALEIEESRWHRDRLLVKFLGCDSRDDAESMRGALYVDGSEVRTLNDDEYWAHDLIGCVAVDPEGAPVGEVRDVLATPAQDLLVIETPRGERLIPFVAAIITEVDTGAKRVTIDAPEGLLD